VNDEQQALFDEQDATHQKEYTTQGLSFNVYGNLTEQWGVNVFGGRRNSRIPVKSGLSENDKVKTAENNDNIGFNAYFTPSDQHKYQFGIQHYNYDKQGYYANTLGSAYTVNTITNTFFINAEHQFEKFKLEQNLNYRTSELDRKLDHNYSALWYYAPGSKDWGTGKTDGDSVTEGSFGGDLTNHQDTFAYSLKATLDSLTLLETTHRITAGASYQHNAGSWERPQNMVSYTTRANLTNASCALGDPLCDETDLKYRLNNRQPFTDWTGQYSRNGISYEAGMFTARQDQWSTFLQDEIIWKKWRARLGVRTDYDSLSSNLNIAPRISMQYKPFSSDILSFSSGYNRYYGNTFLITELDEKTYTSYGNLSRAATYSPDWNAENDYGWVKSSLASNAGVKASELDTPYSDETLFAIHSKISHFDLGLQWVHRDFKAMLQETNINKLNANGMEVLDYRTYSNVEGGKVDTYTLNISNFKPFEFFNSQHKLSLGLSYVENAAKRGNYKDSVTHAKRDDRIIYEGHLISKDMLPIQDEPFKARLSWDMKGNDIPFTLHHFFNFKSSAVNYIHNGDYELLNSEEIPVYVEKEFASKFTWDMRAAYAWNLNPKQSLILGLTVSNVLNKKNQSVTETSAKTYSDEGRRFIADISYKF